MAKIFISYRREDSQYAVDRIYEALRRRLKKRDIFMDVDDIPKGVDFVDYLSAKVAQCETLVAVIGPQWLSVTDKEGRRRLDNPEDFVRIEIAAALKRGIPVVPVLLDGTLMPTAAQLPEDMRGFERRNGAEVQRRSLKADVEALVRDLGYTGGGGRGLIAAFGALAAVAGALVFVKPWELLPQPEPPPESVVEENVGRALARQPANEAQGAPVADTDGGPRPALTEDEAPDTSPDAAETLQPSIDMTTSENLAPGNDLAALQVAQDAARAEAIRDLQRALSGIGLYTSGIDGAAGPGTRAAAARFASETGGSAPDLETAAPTEIAAFTARVEAEATRRAERESAAWDIARRTDTIAAYRAYLADYSAGANVSSANSRIRTLEREAAAAAEAEAWRRAQSSDTITAYQTYLRDYPSGANASAARSRIAALTPPPEPEYRPGETFRDALSSGGQGPEMVVVPSGSFSMGSPAGEAGRDEDEDDKAFAGGRQRTVWIGYEFAVGRYEVTWAEWEACVADGGCNGAGPEGAGGDNGWGRGNRPVIRVDWNDAQAYVQWLSRKTGERYRLLTEAEWEYVARAGISTRFSWGNADPTCSRGASNGANFSSCASDRTEPVGYSAANAFGVHDMHGNVWEWTQDCHDIDYSGAPTDGSARNLSARNVSDCSRRVLRGGSWGSAPQDLRSASRKSSSPSSRNINHGFRVARSLED